MRARVTADELAGGALVPPAAYLVKVTKFEEKPGTKDPSSTTAHITMIIVCDSNGSEENVKGARLMLFPNEKSLGIAPNPSFLVALGAKVDPKTGIDVNLTKDIVGRYVEAYIVRGKDNNGKEQNQAQEFMRLGTMINETVLSIYGQVPAPVETTA